ncbi:Hypothetical predicted protein [Pelobates cultripes]|uniref:Uncharacterized protein n=1 Tax=Pelobates cultripes TaxID=61616 RepID=A0AAD1T4Y4_PELCU|nr:Hypothetical predicted protein [Pelobates cultripes]
MAKPNKQLPSPQANTMADATRDYEGCGGGTDTLTGLNAIFDAIWAKLEARERQAKAQRNLYRESPTSLRHSRAKLRSTDSKQRWRRRQRHLPPARKRLYRAAIPPREDLLGASAVMNPG